MNIKEFATKVAESVEVALKEVEKVEVKEVMKINEILTGITPHKKDANVFPTLYVDGFFNAYTEGELSLEDATKMIIDRVREVISEEQTGLVDIAKQFVNYEGYTRHRLKLCLVNKEKNKELLYEVPHIDILDLAVVVRAIVGDGMSILIKNAHLKKWDIDADRLFADAKNGPVESITYHGYVADRLMLREMFDESGIDVNDLPYDIYRNNQSFNATASLFVNPKEVLSRYDKDIYIVPSSVHNALIIKPECAKAEVIEGLKEILMPTINTDFLERDEFLSNNLYIYRQATGELEIVEEVA